jgi:hypothetical protein
MKPLNFYSFPASSSKDILKPSLERKEETPYRVVGLHLTFQICGTGNPQEIYSASFATMLTPSSLEEKRSDVRIISDK